MNEYLELLLFNYLINTEENILMGNIIAIESLDFLQKRKFF